MEMHEPMLRRIPFLMVRYPAAAGLSFFLPQVSLFLLCQVEPKAVRVAVADKLKIMNVGRREPIGVEQVTPPRVYVNATSIPSLLFTHVLPLLLLLCCSLCFFFSLFSLFSLC